MNMKKYVIFLLCFVFFKASYAEQYLYPVADLDEGKQLLLVYQKSLDSIELWIWNSLSKTAQKGLLSFYTPANLRVLPTKDGFSFIDQGRIRIKKFSKRSPRTLDIYQPISSISSMEWIDDHTYYFVAREGDYFQTFQGTDEGEVQRLTHGQEVDFLYPQKINNQLFCIKRDMNRNFEIVTMPWQARSFYDCQESLSYASLMQLHKPICFLKMLSETEGFYLEYSGFKTEVLQSYNFACYRIVKKEETWTNEYLFQFQVPADTISGTSSSRLYESLEPFLPNYTCKDYAYFVNYDFMYKSFGMYRYHIPSKKVSTVYKPMQKSALQDQYFAPLKVNDALYCGMIIKDVRNSELFIHNFTTGQLQLEVPTISID